MRNTTRILIAAAVLLASLGLAGTTASAALPRDRFEPRPHLPIYIPDLPIVFNQAPDYNDYLVCFNGWVYADFVDADDPDEDLDVRLRMRRNGLWYTTWMNVSGPGAHGVFFYKDISSLHGVPIDQITEIKVRARDPHGAWSEEVTRSFDSDDWEQC